MARVVVPTRKIFNVSQSVRCPGKNSMRNNEKTPSQSFGFESVSCLAFELGRLLGNFHTHADETDPT